MSSIGGTAREPDPEGSPELFGGEVVDDEAFPVDDEEVEDCELPLSCLLGRAGVFTTHTPCAALATPSRASLIASGVTCFTVRQTLTLKRHKFPSKSTQIHIQATVLEH